MKYPVYVSVNSIKKSIKSLKCSGKFLYRCTLLSCSTLEYLYVISAFRIGKAMFYLIYIPKDKNEKLDGLLKI